MADLVEARVRKRVGKRWYTGTVCEVWRGGEEDENALFAHIAYDDGDAEDLLVDEARALLVVKPEAPAVEAEPAQAAPAVEEAAPAVEAAAQPKPTKRKVTALLTDVFARLLPKRAAGADGLDTRCAPAMRCVDAPRARKLRTCFLH